MPGSAEVSVAAIGRSCNPIPALGAYPVQIGSATASTAAVGQSLSGFAGCGVVGAAEALDLDLV